MVPELIEGGLEEIRITGGEPKPSPNFWSFLDTMKNYPSDKLRLAVNSNLGGNFKRIQRLIDLHMNYQLRNLIYIHQMNHMDLITEYIRDGLIYPEWSSHMVAFLEGVNKDIFRSLTVMMTINSLCLFSIDEFLDDMIVLKESMEPNRPNVDFNILRWPFSSPLSLPNDVKEFLHNKLKTWFETRKQDSDFYELFSDGEIAQIERLVDYIEVVKTGHVTTEGENETHFHDFKSFYQQYDKRRGKDFCKTFPELLVWYNQIEVDNTIPDVEISNLVKSHISRMENINHTKSY